MRTSSLALAALLTASATLASRAGIAQEDGRSVRQNDPKAEQNGNVGQQSKDDEDVDVNHLKRCVRLQQIDHTDVVDDSTILFYMRDGTILRNNLPLRCPDLKNQDRFMYRVSLPELCDIDVITVLNDIGGRFMPGASCGLGKFQDISKEAADEIKRVAARTDKEKRK